MPLLALHGTADKLTAPAGSRMLVERAPATDKTLRIYPGLFHDLVHEPKGQQVVTDILAWLDAHTGGPAVAAPPRYDGPLAGDPRGWTQAVEIAGGVSRSLDDQSLHFGGGLAVALARPRPIGWHGALTARWANEHYAVALRPIGVAVRLGSAVIGVSGGASIVKGFNGPQVGAAGGLWYEQPFGPAHFGSAPTTSTRSHRARATPAGCSARCGSAAIAPTGRTPRRASGQSSPRGTSVRSLTSAAS